MSASARLRAAAARVIAAVAEGESLQTALPAAAVTAAQAAQLQALCYGTLRAYVRLNALLDNLLERPLKARDRQLRGLLLVGLFELHEGKTAEHAVVSETVNACNGLNCGHARGLVNAVLRRYLREREQLEARVHEAEHVRYGNPVWLHRLLKQDWPDDWARIAQASNEHPPMWLRVNGRAASVTECESELLQRQPDGVHRHAYAESALCIEKPLGVTAVPGFAQGKLSVQDAGAQLAAVLLAPQPGQRILDACAAPGGKTAHIAELCDGQCQILALDINAERLERVLDNASRLNLPGIVTRCADASRPDAWWDGEQFDRILLDAPCSATGVIRRHPDIRILRRASDVEVLAGQQLQLLEALWPLLRPAGRFLYSTCSVLRAENEEVMGKFLATTADARPCSLPQDMPGRAAGVGRQILPGETGMDGFYYACLIKQGAD